MLPSLSMTFAFITAWALQNNKDSQTAKMLGKF